MALVTSRTSLSQGAETTESVAFTASSGANTTLTGTGLPVVAATDFFEIRLSPISGNNGLYIATGTPTTSSVDCTKVFGADPVNDTSESVTWLGDTTTYKSVYFDTTNNGSCAIMEKGNVDSDGVEGQAIYSFMMQEWKDDDFLIANSPFPMLTIDSDAGKYIIGQDISGNNSGANWLDDTTTSIRTRKLLRSAGWDEVNSSGVTISRYVGVVTLGLFEDSTTDTAYYQFGSDTTVDDTVDFDFAGPVNEAVKFFEEVGNPGTFTYVDGGGGDDTCTRASGSFITDGFKVGGQMTTRASNTPANDGTYVITGVAALTLTFATGTFDTGEADTTVQVSVDNDNAMVLKLRVRDADPKGKTFGQANLASAGKTVLGNFVYAFPLANGADQKIDVTDVGIDSDSNGVPDVSPYSGMTITYYASPQARTDLVGGSVNFGIIVEGNDGTAQEVFEFLQWSLRSTGGNGTGDIDAGAEVAIGRAMDGLAGFVGDTGHFGSPDGGLSFPSNPDGGGSGVYVDTLNALSKNDVIFYDNLEAPKTFPETIAVTLDFNQIAIDDTTTEYDLFYDRTIRTTVADLVLTQTTDVITSATTALPQNSELVVGSYVRLAGMTVAAMDGVYQISVINTPGASWDVARYDGTTIVTSSTASVTVDQNCIDTPDAILVHTNVRTAEVSEPLNPGTAVLDFASPDLINDASSTMGSFAAGMFIQVENSTANDGVYEIATAAAGQLELVEQTITTEAVGVDVDVAITEAVSGLAAADVVFSYDFDNNEQGGRTVSTTTYVKAKAIGSTGAQYIQSSVADIVSGTPETIPVSPATERNYA